MIEFATVARPYAKALFEIAKQQDSQIEAWQKELAQLAWLIQQPKVFNYIEQSDWESTKKADELIRLLADTEASKAIVFRNFIYVLAQEKRLSVLPEIYAQYKALVLEWLGIKEAMVYIAYDIASEGQRAKIVSDLEQRFNVKLQANFQVDRDLIGGLKVVVGDQVLDLSVQGKLKKLYATMTN